MNKNVALVFLLAFVALTVWVGWNDVRLANVIASDGLKGVFWYLVSDFKNWLIVLGVFVFRRDVAFYRRLAGGVALALDADIVSYPRLLSSGVPGVNESIRASLDWIVVSHLGSYGFGWTVYYYVLPLILVFGAFYILGSRRFLGPVSG